MIKISLDEASVFDILSILHIKANKSNKSAISYNVLLSEITKTIGSQKVSSILMSTEYKNLLETNREIFNIVDILNKGQDMSAISVHIKNMDRYKYKKDIQHKFFMSELVEDKV